MTDVPMPRSGWMKAMRYLAVGLFISALISAVRSVSAGSGVGPRGAGLYVVCPSIAGGGGGKAVLAGWGCGATSLAPQRISQCPRARRRRVGGSGWARR